MVDRIDASIGDERMEIFKVAGSTGNVYVSDETKGQL